VGNLSLLESPRKYVGTMTRLGISKETRRKRKREKRRKTMTLVMNLKTYLLRMVEIAILTTHACQIAWSIDFETSFHMTS
jgi:hypothetical protein